MLLGSESQDPSPQAGAKPVARRPNAPGGGIRSAVISSLPGLLAIIILMTWKSPLVVLGDVMDASSDVPSSGQVSSMDLVPMGLVDELALKAPKTAGKANPNADQTWINSSCGSCHQTDTTFSHPVGQVPTMAVPADMPLENGRITCATCHDNSQSLLHTQARTNHTKLLRTNLTGDRFCAQCHTPSRHNRGGSHGATVQKAHLRWTGKIDPKTRIIAGLDEESRTCLSCHDGSVATDIGVPNAIGGNAGSDPGNHPVGVIRRGNSNFKNGFGPRPTDPRIRLFDNSVGCGSCHSPYSNQAKLLVMSNYQSRLCLNCHNEMR